MPVPSHLQPYVQPDSLQIDPDGITSRFMLAVNGETHFAVRYFGEICQGLVVDTPEKPARISAVTPDNQTEIMLFDGALHGYNAMFCDTFDAKLPADRPMRPWDTALYQIRITAFYNIDYIEEQDDFTDEAGNVPLSDGRVIGFDALLSDGIDGLCIELIDGQGKICELLNEELA